MAGKTSLKLHVRTDLLSIDMIMFGYRYCAVHLFVGDLNAIRSQKYIFCFDQTNLHQHYQSKVKIAKALRITDTA